MEPFEDLVQPTTNSVDLGGGGGEGANLEPEDVLNIPESGGGGDDRTISDESAFRSNFKTARDEEAAYPARLNLLDEDEDVLENRVTPPGSDDEDIEVVNVFGGLGKRRSRSNERAIRLAAVQRENEIKFSGVFSQRKMQEEHDKVKQKKALNRAREGEVELNLTGITEALHHYKHAMNSHNVGIHAQRALNKDFGVVRDILGPKAEVFSELNERGQKEVDRLLGEMKQNLRSLHNNNFMAGKHGEEIGKVRNLTNDIAKDNLRHSLDKFQLYPKYTIEKVEEYASGLSEAMRKRDHYKIRNAMVEMDYHLKELQQVGQNNAQLYQERKQAVNEKDYHALVGYKKELELKEIKYDLKDQMISSAPIMLQAERLNALKPGVSEAMSLQTSGIQSKGFKLAMQQLANDPQAKIKDREKYVGYSVMHKLLSKAILEPEVFGEMRDQRKVLNAENMAQTVQNIYQNKVQTPGDVERLIGKLAEGKTLPLYEKSRSWIRRGVKQRDFKNDDVGYWTAVTQGFLEDVLEARNGPKLLQNLQSRGELGDNSGLRSSLSRSSHRDLNRLVNRKLSSAARSSKRMSRLADASEQLSLHFDPDAEKEYIEGGDIISEASSSKNMFIPVGGTSLEFEGRQGGASRRGQINVKPMLRKEGGEEGDVAEFVRDDYEQVLLMLKNEYGFNTVEDIKNDLIQEINNFGLPSRNDPDVLQRQIEEFQDYRHMLIDNAQKLQLDEKGTQVLSEGEKLERLRIYKWGVELMAGVQGVRDFLYKWGGGQVRESEGEFVRLGHISEEVAQKLGKAFVNLGRLEGSRREQDSIDRELFKERKFTANDSRISSKSKAISKKMNESHRSATSSQKALAKNAVRNVIKPLIGDPDRAEMITKEIVAATGLDPARFTVSNKLGFLYDVPKVASKPTIMRTTYPDPFSLSSGSASVSALPKPKDKLIPYAAMERIAAEHVEPVRGPSTAFYGNAAGTNLRMAEFMKNNSREGVLPPELVSHASSSSANKLVFGPPPRVSDIGVLSHMQKEALPLPLAVLKRPDGPEISGEMGPALREFKKAVMPDATSAARIHQNATLSLIESVRTPPVNVPVGLPGPSINETSMYFNTLGGRPLGAKVNIPVTKIEGKGPPRPFQFAPPAADREESKKAGGGGGGGGGGVSGGGSSLGREDRKKREPASFFEKTRRSVSRHLYESMAVVGTAGILGASAYYMFSGAGGGGEGRDHSPTPYYSAAGGSPFEDGTSYYTARGGGGGGGGDDVWSMGSFLYNAGRTALGVGGAIGAAMYLGGAGIREASKVSKAELEKARLDDVFNYERQARIQKELEEAKVDVEYGHASVALGKAREDLKLREAKLNLKKEENKEELAHAGGMESFTKWEADNKVEQLRLKKELAESNRMREAEAGHVDALRSKATSAKDAQAAAQFEAAQKLKQDKFEYEQRLDKEKLNLERQAQLQREERAKQDREYKLKLEQMDHERELAAAKQNLELKKMAIDVKQSNAALLNEHKMSSFRADAEHFKYKKDNNELLFSAKNNNLRQANLLRQEGSLIYQQNMAKQAKAEYAEQRDAARLSILIPGFQSFEMGDWRELEEKQPRAEQLLQGWLGGNDGTQIERMLGANRDLKDVVRRVENPQTISSLFGVDQTRKQLLQTQNRMHENQKTWEELAADQKVFQNQLGDAFAGIASMVPLNFKQGRPDQLAANDRALVYQQQKHITDLVLDKVSDTLGLGFYQAKKGQIIDEVVIQTMQASLNVIEQLISQGYITERLPMRQLEFIMGRGQQFVQDFMSQNEHYQELYQEQLNLVEERLLDAETGLRAKEDKIKRKDKISDEIEKKLQLLGLNDRVSGQGGQGGQGNNGNNWARQRYMRSRLDEMFDGSDPRQREQIDEARTKQAILDQVGQGKSITGNFGNAASVSQNALKVATKDKKITSEDIALLKQVTIDKRTGLAMKISPDGTLVDLTPEEKERVAHAIIEICLYLYAKNVKAVTQLQIEQYRGAIQANVLEQSDSDEGREDVGLLNLVKVANTVANKLVQGGLNQYQLKKYIKTLAGQDLPTIDEKDEEGTSKRRERRPRRRDRPQQQEEEENAEMQE